MRVELTKEDHINLLMSVKPSSMKDCDDLTKRGMMKFTGNQWNEDWDWNENHLQTMTENRLWMLYNLYK